MFNREKTHDIRGFDDKKISRFLEMQFLRMITIAILQFSVKRDHWTLQECV